MPTTRFTARKPSALFSHIRRASPTCARGVSRGSSRGSGISLSSREMLPICGGTGIEGAGSRSSAARTDQPTPGSHRIVTPSRVNVTAMRSMRRRESARAARRILSFLSSSKLSHGRDPDPRPVLTSTATVRSPIRAIRSISSRPTRTFRSMMLAPRRSRNRAATVSPTTPTDIR